jgi:hypothetical protein
LEELALVALLLTQRAGQEGTIAGTLRLNGAPVAITHVYASAQPGFFDKNSEDVRVLFSDVPLSDAARTDTFALMKLARTGPARIVEVVIDAAGAAISGAIYAREFGGMVSVSGMHVFTRDRLERTAVAGRLAVTPDREFAGVRWAYDVTFSAPIPRPPTAAELAAQLSSPPAHAAEAHLAALRGGMLPVFLATMTPAAAADFSGTEGQTRFRDFRAEMPADAKVVELVPQTDGTVLAKIEGHERGILIGYTFRMVLDGQVWKVGK